MVDLFSMDKSPYSSSVCWRSADDKGLWIGIGVPESSPPSKLTLKLSAVSWMFATETPSSWGMTKESRIRQDAETMVLVLNIFWAKISVSGQGPWDLHSGLTSLGFCIAHNKSKKQRKRISL
jgi:hypothetical protein